jgi:hypothetical protein
MKTKRRKDIGKTNGRHLADSLFLWGDLMYNNDTKKRVLTACRDRLNELIPTIPKSSRKKKGES